MSNILPDIDLMEVNPLRSVVDCLCFVYDFVIVRLSLALEGRPVWKIL